MSGPKKGSVRTGSLAAKLTQLRIGEWLCLPDHEPADIPTLMERNIQTALFRSPALDGFGLTTERVLIVGQGFQTCHALRITRHA